MTEKTTFFPELLLAKVGKVVQILRFHFYQP